MSVSHSLVKFSCAMPTANTPFNLHFSFLSSNSDCQQWQKNKLHNILVAVKCNSLSTFCNYSIVHIYCTWAKQKYLILNNFCKLQICRQQYKHKIIMQNRSTDISLKSQYGIPTVNENKQWILYINIACDYSVYKIFITES